MTVATAWRRSVVVALVLAGALAAAAVVCVTTFIVRRHLQQDAQPRPVAANRTDGTGGGTPDQGDGAGGSPADGDPKGPVSGSEGCASISRARRCTSRCGCVWCPPGDGFGCHEFVVGARPCGSRDGRRLSPWACDAHFMTWLSVGGAGLVCALFVGLAIVVWCLWPRLCLWHRDRRAASADAARTSAASPLVGRHSINGP